MATVADALKLARTLLNDDSGGQWHDSVLLPKVVQAHGELVSKLVLNGIDVVKSETTLISIPKNSLDMGVNQPTDIIRPIKMDELAPGDTISNAAPMQVVDFIPNLEQTETLRYWAWLQERIVFIGATTDRQVHLYYERGPVAPTKVTDTLMFTLSENFIGPRVAALAMLGKDKELSVAANQIAENNLSMIVRIQVKAGQNLPVRRRPFSYSQKRGRSIR